MLYDVIMSVHYTSMFSFNCTKWNQDHGVHTGSTGSKIKMTSIFSVTNNLQSASSTRLLHHVITVYSCAIYIKEELAWYMLINLLRRAFPCSFTFRHIDIWWGNTVNVNSHTLWHLLCVLSSLTWLSKDGITLFNAINYTAIINYIIWSFHQYFYWLTVVCQLIFISRLQFIKLHTHTATRGSTWRILPHNNCWLLNKLVANSTTFLNEYNNNNNNNNNNNTKNKKMQKKRRRRI